MIPLEGAGKGDTPRSVSNRIYGKSFESIFGKKTPPKTFKRFHQAYGEQGGKGNAAFFVPDMTPRFNSGLGCVTYGTRDAEKKGRLKGLDAIGDVSLDKVFKPHDYTSEDKALIRDCLLETRAKMRKEGKL